MCKALLRHAVCQRHREEGGEQASVPDYITHILGDGNMSGNSLFPS